MPLDVTALIGSGLEVDRIRIDHSGKRTCADVRARYHVHGQKLGVVGAVPVLNQGDLIAQG